MEAIKINVNKQLDGFNFSIAPPIRELIRQLFPNARPANNIFVEYDTKSGFDNNYSKIEPKKNKFLPNEVQKMLKRMKPICVGVII